MYLRQVGNRPITVWETFVVKHEHARRVWRESEIYALAISYPQYPYIYTIHINMYIGLILYTHTLVNRIRQK